VEVERMAAELIRTLEPGKTLVLRELSTGTGRVRADIGDYSDVAVHVLVSGASGLAYDVEVSNVDSDTYSVVMTAAADKTATGIYKIDPTGARYCSVNVKTLSAGMVGIVLHAKRAGRT
jgi:hypothetical protein